MVIACLGDMVEGQDIFRGQIWKLDRHVVDQAIDGANDTAGAFIEILLTFPELNFEIFEVHGNHGRVGRKGEDPPGCSMDKVYQDFLEAQIQRAGDLKNVRFHRHKTHF